MTKEKTRPRSTVSHCRGAPTLKAEGVTVGILIRDVCFRWTILSDGWDDDYWQKDHLGSS